MHNCGMLYGDGGSITIRGQRVATEGVGENGVVSNRAATISQIAVDPGPDGIEEVVRNRSVIVNQAKNITIQSNGAEKDGFAKVSYRQKTGYIPVAALGRAPALTLARGTNLTIPAN